MSSPHPSPSSASSALTEPPPITPGQGQSLEGLFRPQLGSYCQGHRSIRDIARLLPTDDQLVQRLNAMFELQPEENEEKWQEAWTTIFKMLGYGQVWTDKSRHANYQNLSIHIYGDSINIRELNNPLRGTELSDVQLHREIVQMLRWKRERSQILAKQTKAKDRISYCSEVFTSTTAGELNMMGIRQPDFSIALKVKLSSGQTFHVAADVGELKTVEAEASDERNNAIVKSAIAKAVIYLSLAFELSGTYMGFALVDTAFSRMFARGNNEIVIEVAESFANDAVEAVPFTKWIQLDDLGLCLAHNVKKMDLSGSNTINDAVDWTALAILLQARMTAVDALRSLNPSDLVLRRPNVESVLGTDVPEKRAALSVLKPVDREALFVTGNQIDKPDRDWIRKQIRENEGVIVTEQQADRLPNAKAGKRDRQGEDSPEKKSKKPKRTTRSSARKDKDDEDASPGQRGGGAFGSGQGSSKSRSGESEETRDKGGAGCTDQRDDGSTGEGGSGEHDPSTEPTHRGASSENAIASGNRPIDSDATDERERNANATDKGESYSDSDSGASWCSDSDSDFDEPVIDGQQISQAKELRFLMEISARSAIRIFPVSSAAMDRLVNAHRPATVVDASPLVVKTDSPRVLDQRSHSELLEPNMLAAAQEMDSLRKRRAFKEPLGLRAARG